MLIGNSGVNKGFGQVFRPFRVRRERRNEHGGEEIRLHQAGAETP